MIFEILEQIANTSSRNEKEAILKYNNGNALLKEVIRLAYDPFTNFYIKKIPFATEHSDTISLRQGLEHLKALSSREVTGNEAIERLRSVLSWLSEEDASVLARVVGKDLRIGCTGNTANKIWKDLVLDYPCMLCSVYEEKLISKMTWPAIFQLKMDGMRFNAIVRRDGSVEFRTRNGKVLDLLGELEQEFRDLAGNDPDSVGLVFDGELLVGDGTALSRQAGNGILVKAQKGTLSKEEASLVRATLWDVIPLCFFKAKGIAEIPYSTRFDDLKMRMRNHPSNKIRLVQTSTVGSLDVATEQFENYLSQGLEGGILKDPNGYWEDKRSRTQIKFKGELTTDLLCVAWCEGTGKYTGMMGKLDLESSDGKVKVHVGTGFTDEHRQTIKPEDVMGKIIEIKYNAKISDKKSDTDSLFLPVFLSIREDKNEADSSEKIK